MPAEVLIDTGAILALLDKQDHWHTSCLHTFAQLRFPLLTSEAVLTEAFHLIRRSRTKVEAVWGLIRSGTIILASIENQELSRINSLMTRYRDRPMDFADATLVHLAERESIQVIFTVDQNDFATYRIAGRRRFQIIPVERP
jgi:predicted nucleic acid-binding protein